MIVQDNKHLRYIKVDYNNEDELETIVFRNHQLLFGESSIVIPKKKITTPEGTGTIPDGFVISPEDDKWFLLEVELVTHSIWEHIVKQVSKQITAIETESTKRLLINEIFGIVTDDIEYKKIFEDLGIKSTHIKNKIENIILNNKPVICIPIDNVTQDLKTWVRTLNYKVEIWRINKYQNIEDENDVLYKFPDEFSPSVRSSPETGIEELDLSNKLGISLKSLIENKKLKSGQKVHLSYKPRGGKTNKFEGTIIEEGYIDVDGKRLDPSPAAVYCYNKIGSDRPTENGWKKWKTDDGKSLSDLRDEMYDEIPKN